MAFYWLKPGKPLHLGGYNAANRGGFKDKSAAREPTEKLLQKLTKLQGRLYAEKQRALLVVLQGVDASGKDGTIRHVLRGVSPLGCVVTSFKAPTPAEKAHDFLWRVHAVCPPLGYFGIFNRSHYEDVLITQVHGWIGPKEVKRRVQQIRDFEQMLTANGTHIVKFFLHISKREQKKRFLSRLENPDKRWKFDPADLDERRYWKAYQRAHEEVLPATSTKDAPWVIVPSDHKWYRNWFVADALVQTLERLSPKTPSFPALHEKKLLRELQRS